MRAPAAGIDLPLPDKPSIAVLPLTNTSGDPEHLQRATRFLRIAAGQEDLGAAIALR